MLNRLKIFITSHLLGLIVGCFITSLILGLICGGIVANTPLMDNFINPPDLKPVERIIGNINSQYFSIKSDVIKTYNNRVLQAKNSSKPVETNIMTKDLTTSDDTMLNYNIIKSSNNVISSYPNLCQQLLEKVKTIYRTRLETINNRIRNNGGIDYDSLLTVKSFDDKPVLQQAKDDFLNKIREKYKTENRGNVVLNIFFSNIIVFCIISTLIVLLLYYWASETLIPPKTSKYHHHYRTK